MTLLFPTGSPLRGPSANCLWSGDKAEREVGKSKPGREGGGCRTHPKRKRVELVQATNYMGLSSPTKHRHF
jgi:hypothetical protein